MRFANKESYQILQDNFKRLGVEVPESEFFLCEESGIGGSQYIKEPCNKIYKMEGDIVEICPAYSLDELLDMLPKQIECNNDWYFFEIDQVYIGFFNQFEQKLGLKVIAYDGSLTQSACDLVNWTISNHEEEFINHMKVE